jgi:hypothetical protein
MSSIEAVAYLSSAVGSPTEADLATLLERARAKNLELGVTGVLLYHEGTFFQYFEGPPEAVEVVYRRIQRDPMHHGLIELMRAPVEARAFSDWSMGFTRAPKSMILQLSSAKWIEALRKQGQASFKSPGMSLLARFWEMSGNEA